ncbi:hypothetical protein BHM03_00022979, partial [Ensete ventricosum]
GRTGFFAAVEFPVEKSIREGINTSERSHIGLKALVATINAANAALSISSCICVSSLSRGSVLLSYCLFVALRISSGSGKVPSPHFNASLALPLKDKQMSTFFSHRKKE